MKENKEVAARVSAFFARSLSSSYIRKEVNKAFAKAKKNEKKSS